MFPGEPEMWGKLQMRRMQEWRGKLKKITGQIRERRVDDGRRETIVG